MSGRSLDTEYVGTDLVLARLARFFIRHRRAGVILQLFVLIVGIWAIAGMRLYDDPNQWPPKSDRFAQLNREIAGHFGGANSVSIEVAAVHGTIYTPDNLATVKSITDALYLVKGIIPYAVRSIATLDARKLDLQGIGTDQEVLTDTPLMPQYPKSAAEAAAIGTGARSNPLIDGVLVSKDGTAALILADFRSEQPGGAIKVATTEPVAIYHALNAILKANRRPGIVLRAAGTPITIGWVNSDGLLYVGVAFFFFIIMIVLTLWHGFRTLSGVALPLRVSLLGVLMGFLLYRIFFGDTLHSASALIAPFIIVAAGACHSVQFLTRFFFTEYPRRRSVEEAIVSTFVSRLRPMLVSLLCDVIPFAVMALTPFENVRTLGIVAALGLLSLTIDEFLMMIPALSSIALRELETSNRKAVSSESRVDETLARLVRNLMNGGFASAAVVLGCLVVTGLGVREISLTKIGQNNSFAIHNYLTHSWNRSDIYRMEKDIDRHFGGVYPLTVLIAPRPGEHKILENPAVMKAIDQLAAFLRSRPHVGNVADVAHSIKLYNQIDHDERSDYFTVPDKRGIGAALYAMVGVAPGAYDWLFAENYDSTVIIAYTDSTDPKVVSNLIGDTQQKVNELFPSSLPVRVGVAGGSVGIAEAFNRNVGFWLIVSSALGFLGTFLVALCFIRSPSLAGLLIVPLILGTVTALGLMVAVGIEVNSNAAAALAIASGVGIDSEIYLLYRVREEYQSLPDFREALVRGYINIRHALLISNGALILGCWCLVPVPLYIGYVGFGMGLVLFICFVMSALISPIAWSWLGEKAIIGDVKSGNVVTAYNEAV